MKFTEEMEQKLHAHIDEMREAYLEEWKRVAAQPSVSAQNIGVEECCSLLTSLFGGLGLKTKILESPTKPAIYAELRSKREDAPTVLFYGHYDVQPPEPLELWHTEPFQPTVKDGRLYGRGTADNKGQFMAHVMAVRAFLELFEDVPVHIKFLLDGEEESGSPSLPWIARENKELLAADLMYVSDGGMYDDVTPQIVYGNRGILSFEIHLSTAS